MFDICLLWSRDGRVVDVVTTRTVMGENHVDADEVVHAMVILRRLVMDVVLTKVVLVTVSATRFWVLAIEY